MESARLNEIVGDLLSLSRAEADAGAEEIYFDLGGLLEVICEDARFEAQPRGIQVELVLALELGDPDHAPLLKGRPAAAAAGYRERHPQRPALQPGRRRGSPCRRD
ncbi:MAG: hypothetical protein WDN45_05520 [Caulobacteraceae bacterium]